ncbi:shikimate kinase [Desulfonatronum thiodismutans]|uniref:shikimate kinase n=1 Tax=Desulfonatronum thiodismutans TaxID=159290 RepID=UPI00068D8A70|nr:shikimate kinase [Desulfonatronum thiodismutans]
MSRFIQNTIQVGDPELRMVHDKGARKKAVFDPQATNIFLVGLRASGKSTLGKPLAQRLDMRFVDTDVLVLDKAGRSIADIVAANGWDAFRGLESEVLREVCARRGQVVATGGGMILAAENQKLIQQSGTTFFLMADISTLLGRLNAAPDTDHRPPLTNLTPEQELIQSNIQRGPIYMNLADHILHTEDSLEHTLRDALDKLDVR